MRSIWIGVENECRTHFEQKVQVLGDPSVPVAGHMVNVWHSLSASRAPLRQLLRPQQLANVWKMPHWGLLGNLPPLMLSVPYNMESKTLSFTATSRAMCVWY